MATANRLKTPDDFRVVKPKVVSPAPPSIVASLLPPSAFESNPAPRTPPPKDSLYVALDDVDAGFPASIESFSPRVRASAFTSPKVPSSALRGNSPKLPHVFPTHLPPPPRLPSKPVDPEPLPIQTPNTRQQSQQRQRGKRHEQQLQQDDQRARNSPSRRHQSNNQSPRRQRQQSLQLGESQCDGAFYPTPNPTQSDASTRPFDYASLIAGMSEKLESQKLTSQADKERLLDQICQLQKHELNLMKRLEQLDVENQFLKSQNEFLSSRESNSSCASPATVTAAQSVPVVEKGIQVENGPSQTQADFLEYVTLKQNNERLVTRIAENEVELGKRAQCIATLKSLLEKLKPGFSPPDMTDTPANYVPLLDDGDLVTDFAPTSSWEKREVDRLESLLAEQNAKVLSLSKMLNMTLNDSDDEAAKKTKKWKDKVHQLLTQAHLKDREVGSLKSQILRLENELETCKSSRSSSTSSDLDASLIPYVEKIGSSIDDFYSTLSQPLFEADLKLKSFDARLRYGGQRLRLVQNLLSRNDSVSAAELQRLRERQRRDVLVGEIDSLKAELNRVQKEREHLALKLKNDASMLDEKIKQAHGLEALNDALKTKIQTVEDRVVFLEESLKEVTEENEGRVKAKEEEILYFQARAAEYEKTLGEKETGIAEEVEGRVEELRGRYDAEQSRLKTRLDEVQREYAKVSVQLQQTQRELSNERHSARVVMRDLEASQSCVNDKLREKIETLQSEQRVILDAIERQGMLDQLLSATRGNPRHVGLYKQLNSLTSTVNGVPESPGNARSYREDPSLSPNSSDGSDTRASGQSPFAVINNLEMAEMRGHGFVDVASAVPSTVVPMQSVSNPYSTEQMMAAIRELQNDVNLLCEDGD